MKTEVNTVNENQIGRFSSPKQREMKTEVNTVNENQIGRFSSPKQPVSVGGYRFGSTPSFYTQFNLSYKPKWFHRTMMRICLDMHWFDN
jgi:hypothetical protein